MPEAIRQSVVLGRLLVRSLLRLPVNVGGAPGKETGRQVSKMLLIALFLAATANSFWTIGASFSKSAHARSFLLLFISFLVVAATLGREVPGPLQRRFLGGPVLDTQPIHPAARLILAMGQNALAWCYGTVGLLGAAPAWRHSAAGWLALVGVSSVLCIATTIGATGLLAVLRLTQPSERIPRLLQVIGYGSLLLAFAALGAGLWAVGKQLAWLPVPLLPLGRALHKEAWADLITGMLPLGLLAALGLVAITLAEAQGYDRQEAAPSKVKDPTAQGRLTLAKAESLMLRRHSGRLLSWGITMVLLVTVVFGARKFRELEARVEARTRLDVQHEKSPSPELKPATGAPLETKTGGKLPDPMAIFMTMVALLVVEMGGSLGLGFAARVVQRDVAARPFLSPLPISPSQTLAGKAKSLRILVLPLGLALVPLFYFSPGDWPALLWRLTAIEIGLFLLCEAAPAVSFLTNGLGSPNASTLARPFSIASLLLLLPALRVALAESMGGAALALVALGALAFEARRAAARCVRWLDDADEALSRDTPVWRALLVFAAFVAIQGFVVQLLTLGSGLGTSAWVLPGGYLFSAAALLLLTVARRQGLPKLAVLPRQRWLLPVGLVAGLGSGALGVGYLHLLERLGIQPPEIDPMTSQASAWGMVLAVVVAAPIAEETFFRGWLQPAIGLDLPSRYKSWAVALGAMTFAVVHPPMSFIPVCILGLVAGFLYELGGGLLPGLLAHAAHNAVALWLGS